MAAPLGRFRSQNDISQGSRPRPRLGVLVLLGSGVLANAMLHSPIASAQVAVGAAGSSGGVPVAVGAPGTPSAASPAPAPVTNSGVVGARASLEPIAPTIPDGVWVCPLPVAKFRNDWGEPRSGGRKHEGTDMFAPMGTPIITPINGTVRFDESGLGGRQFWLKTDKGVTVYGAHLESYGTAGKINAGDVIGTVGDTGNAKGGAPHLHFEVHPTKNNKINPFALLDSIC